MMYHNMITDIQEFTGNPPYSISPYSTGKASNRLHGPWGPFNLAFLGPDLYVANNADGTVSAILPTEGPLANEIFLDVDADTGLRAGLRWKDALRQANARCEAVICLLSANWEASHECKIEYRTAENLNKQIFCARLEPTAGSDITTEWQRCDLFGDGAQTLVDVGGGPPVVFATEGLYRLRDAIRGAGIGVESFVWPPPAEPGRAPYRGGNPSRPPMRRCSSGATPRSCALWTRCVGCAWRG
jgi:hypothetical protein